MNEPYLSHTKNLTLGTCQEALQLVAFSRKTYYRDVREPLR